MLDGQKSMSPQKFLCHFSILYCDFAELDCIFIKSNEYCVDMTCC